MSNKLFRTTSPVEPFMADDKLLTQKMPAVIHTVLKAFYKREIKRMQEALNTLNTTEPNTLYWSNLLKEITRPSDARFMKAVYGYAHYAQANADGGDLELQA